MLLLLTLSLFSLSINDVEFVKLPDSANSYMDRWLLLLKKCQITIEDKEGLLECVKSIGSS